MKALPQDKDLPQKLFTLMFFVLMIVASFWIVQPFILGFAWAGMVVIATWGLMLRIQKYLWGRRSLAVLVMTLILLLVFIIPIALLISSVIDNIGPVVAWATSGHIEIPKLEWLDKIPLAGNKMAIYYHKMVAGGGSAMMAKIQPYIGQTTSFFVAQAGHFGRLLVHLALMLLFSVLLYWRGERVGQGIRHFAYRLAGRRGDAVVLLAGQAIRAVALGVVVTALLQGVVGGIGLAIAGIPYATLLTVVMILCCLIQIGPLLVLVPAIIWLYWSGDTTWGTVLLVWSCVVGTMDSVIRPMLIRLGADLPMLIILSGVIGGLVSFGMIGLFIGPVVLAVSYRLVSVWMHQAPEPHGDPELVVEELIEDTRKTAEQARHARNNSVAE
ncbi:MULTISPECIES: AI-2E family transporter YdiK [Tatumella]|uniref:AI-2E family transporter YdiK n=1 Tax=Tatumella punctata TaxID=399969 RepID=A0ABW1VIY9_9GAMM|nr:MULTISPECIES: AI-2E family transporter YdiK [unclassified Tatumella]MBS0855023.1 AI-2E family transporter YdiK [Tatumella sp. JGM16]MBS0876054.1 AI-2E family transporter YdiK [Tatumella sp. JGM82]MBS0890528.1 AI-2E family transporter YdiK [Tatumella sp. JGM94]MBS0892639.1 AI-2E family transporter YdiK [Tatumella sp. JGM130]MBS0900984.1 AI-2E family transporter YdiK [Tatumella sp. JGM100]